MRPSQKILGSDHGRNLGFFDNQIYDGEMKSNGPLPPLEQLKHVHIIGVCGTLMGAFAASLKRAGIRVTGSDQNVYPPMSDVLRQAGVELAEGYSPENLTRFQSRPELVVIGNVIGASNPEARAAIDGGLAYTSLPEAMEKLMLPQTRNLVVAGTHGKTTCSSMLAHVLNSAGQSPSYFIGGVSLDLPVSFEVKDLRPGGFFVLEGDEYDTAFWDKVPKFNHYLPDQVILTSVEFDHADIYADLGAVERAFSGLLTRIREGGSLVACSAYPSVLKLLPEFKGKTTLYGPSGDPRTDYWVDRIRPHSSGICFDIVEAKTRKTEATLKINLSGEHNALNATAVWILARAQGLSNAEIQKGLKSFQGVKRRQEVRGEVSGVTVIDDFAHHPTAVRETLKALRVRYSEPHGSTSASRRLLVVFEPRSATSRRKVFQAQYAEAFGAADLVWIAAPYDQSKISENEQFSSEQLVADLQKNGKVAQCFSAVDEGVRAVAQAALPGDVVIVLSNGGFGGFIQKLLSELGSTSKQVKAEAVIEN